MIALLISSALGLSGIGAALWFFPALLPAAVKFLRSIPPLWLAIALCGAVAAFCWHGWVKDHARLVACQDGRAADRKAYSDAQAEATRIAIAAKRATEARYAAIEKDKTDEIARAHTANRDALARWLRDKAATGSRRSADMSATAGATESVDRPAATAIVVDTVVLERCTDAFTVAEGWQAWWAAVSAK